MKEELLKTMSKYLEIFPDEKERQKQLIEYLNNHEDDELNDCNNFDGHITAGGLIYALKEKKFLVLHHRDLDMFLYPGGHMEKEDKNTLETARREVKEETGLDNLTQLKITGDELMPIDIDTHLIPYNKKRNLPKHYHFDFRYMFILDKEVDIKIDNNESSEYKWISMDDLRNDKNYGRISLKLESIINKD